MRHLSLIVFCLVLSFVSRAALPPILGPTTLCAGSAASLSNPVTGGTWTSGSPAIATIGSTTGIVNGVSAGTTVITYTDGIDFAFATITVNASPTAIIGSTLVCAGTTSGLACSPAGGLWSAATPAVGTISSVTGVFGGISAGTCTVTYTIAGSCYATAVMTVAPIPSIVAPSVVCVGGIVTASATPAAGTWASAAPGIATISSAGIISPVAPGTVAISYTSAAGCVGATVVTVNSAIGTISGPSVLCMPATIALSNSVGGGTWTSSHPSVGTVGATTGVVTGLATGTTNISYVIGGCYNVQVVTVNTAPSAITGTATVCAGSTTTLTSTPATGAWSSVAPAIATVSAGGVVTGAVVGTTTISYNNACGSASRVVTVTSSCIGTPVPGLISASSTLVCIGTPLTLSLPAYSPACGHIIQWQSSPDGIGWTDMAGANTVPYTHAPTAARYYRCRITCASSGLSATSGFVLVNVNYAIGTHYVVPPSGSVCAPAQFYIEGCGTSSTFTVITSFGDGTSDTTALTGSTPPAATVPHTYTIPGVYTVRHILRHSGIPVDTVTFTYNSYCSVFPVRLYRDNNSNCLFDAPDSLNNVPVMIAVRRNGVLIDTISVTSGFDYPAAGAVGTIYSFTPIPVSGGYTFNCPVAGGVILDTVPAVPTAVSLKRIGMRCGASPATFDLRVNSTVSAGRHTQRIDITVDNFSCLPAPAILTVNYNPKYGYYSGLWPCTRTSPVPSTVSGTTLTWNLGTIAGNSVRKIVLYLERPSSLGPWLTVGDTVATEIKVTPYSGDIDTLNNVIVRTDTVKASFDPNDLAVTPTGNILPCTWLHYKVRFENMGNDTAINVHVLDTLPAWVDETTLQPIVASHAMNTSVFTAGGISIAKFEFPNIRLTDTSNRQLCHGMFIFRVKAKTTVPDGTDITNRVGIYFDDNEVVMTNEVNNTTGVPPIQGPDHICLGYPDTLFNSMPGGVWASSTPTAGTIATTGIVTGIAAGTSTISYTVSNACTSRTATKVVTVAAIVTPSVGVVTTDDTVCSGSPVIFTTAPVFGGSTPSYQWAVNGLIVGAGDAYSYLPATGDEVSVIMTTSQACALPLVVADTITMTVLPTGTPVVLVSVTPNDTSCAGTLVTYTANAVMGGPSPVYRWFVNGILSGAAPTYAYVPTDGDLIYCRMGSNYHCRLADTVNSAVINQRVDPLYLPVISISASPSLTVNEGSPITFTAFVTGAGPSPAFEWFVNSSLVPGATTSTFTTTTLSDYDSVTCRVTGSGVCSIVTFNSVYVTILPVGVGHIAGGAGISIFPNPGNGQFRIRAASGAFTTGDVRLTVSDVLGQNVYSGLLQTGANGIDAVINLPQSLASGVYMLNMGNGVEARQYRLIVGR